MFQGNSSIGYTKSVIMETSYWLCFDRYMLMFYRMKCQSEYIPSMTNPITILNVTQIIKMIWFHNCQVGYKNRNLKNDKNICIYFLTSL